jgi:sugar lactone lactonase YvrE
MHFNPSRLILRILLCLCVVPSSACQNSEPSSASEGVSGTLQLPLVATSNGQRYRLRNASFVIEGPTPLVLDVEEASDQTLLSAPLVVGSYELMLQGEWFLERLDSSGPVRIDASLVSANPIHFEIEASATRAITLSFTTAAGAISFEQGTLAVGIDVTPIAGNGPAPGLNRAAGQLGGYGFADGVGTVARLAWPERIASDGKGHLFVTDSNSVRQFDVASSVLTTLVGGAYGSSDSTAEFCSLTGIAVGSDGNLSLATRTVTTLAGSPGELGNVDGMGSNARFGELAGLAADAQGNLYVADVTNGEIRKISLANAEVTTLAGGVNQGFDQDGSGTEAAFASLQDLALGANGSLFVAEKAAVREVRPDTGEVTTLANASALDPTFDGVFTTVSGIAADDVGNVYVTNENFVQKIVIESKQVTILAGQTDSASPKDGVGDQASFFVPNGIAFDRRGSLYLAEEFSSMLRRVDVASAEVVTVVGAVVAGDSGSSGSDPLEFANGMTVDGHGNAYTATPGHMIQRVVLATGEVTKFAGRYDPFYASDGPRLFASFLEPTDVTCDADGNLYVSDGGSNAIRKIDVTSGEVSTLAGALGASGFADGVGANAMFAYPRSIESDGQGNLYIVDFFNIAIRKLSIASREVTTLVGPAAGLPYLYGLTSDGQGNLYSLDYYGGAVLKIGIATGEVQTLAGGVEPGFADGVGGAARFDAPTDLVSDHAGNLYVVDAGNRLIRKIELATAMVTTVVGTPNAPAGVLLGALPGRLNELVNIAMLPGGALVFRAEGALLTAR